VSEDRPVAHKIGIDYTAAARQGAGIGRLTRGVVRALAEIDRENEYTLLIKGRGIPYPPPVPHPRNQASGIASANFGEVRTRISERWWTRLWYRLHLPIPVEWLIGPVDLFHSPDFTLPPTLSGTRTIVTVHDLSFLRVPHCFEQALLDYLTVHVPRAVSRADWLLADSESTRRDLVELLGAPEARISVVYPGVEPRFRPIDDAEALEQVRVKYGLPRRFVLSVGTIQPRKNTAGLIEALSRLRATDVALVVVGGRGWLYEDVYAYVQELGVSDRVHWAGYVDDADLPALYSLSAVFALPSLYEGFGIPPLEAMACGTPVVTADNSSFPEVVGDAGIMVNADDIDSLTDRLDAVLEDAALRRSLVEKGLAQARRFTWQEAARSLRAVYEKVGSL